MLRCGSLIRRSPSRFDRLLALPFFRESLCGLAAETPIRKPFDFASERIGWPVFRPGRFCRIRFAEVACKKPQSSRTMKNGHPIFVGCPR